ncbi:MAG: hypothetical protein EOM52_10125 [Clostridia bacterium]|nr:hypothetical protein [Clostridia bacterium]
MKRFRTRTAAFSLSLVLLTGLVSPAFASQALGDDLHTGSVGLAPGTQLTRSIFWSNSQSDLRTERYVTYQPSSGVYPLAVYGDKVTSKGTLSTMAASLEAKGLKVVAGVNGDFFDMSTGNTLGVLISDGVLRSTSTSYFNAVGFLRDGTAIIGQPQIAVTATFNGSTLQVTDVNKTRTSLTDKTPGGYYIYTSDYAKTTQHTSPGVDVILTPLNDNVGQEINVDLDVSKSSSGTPAAQSDAPANADATDSSDLSAGDLPEGPAPISEVKATLTQSNQLIVGGRVSCTVDQVLQSTGSIDIPEGKLVMTINSKNNEWLVSQLSALKSGDKVDIDVTAPDARWADVDAAIGGFYRIVTGGQVGPQTDSTANPRTAVGVKADGTVVIYTIDGKQPSYSIGGSLKQVAQRMIELGCVDAVGLDGGGSTMIGATLPTDSTMQILNKPSDGSQRAVSTALFLVSDLKSTGNLDHLLVSPYDAMVLAGSSVALKAIGVDSSYYSMGAGSDITWSIHNGDGTVSADGVFKSAGESGTCSVTATTGITSGNATGSSTMTVVKTPDSINLTPASGGAILTSLSLEPNQTADLNASAIYKKMTLTSQDTAYTWTLDPAVGTVDQNGVITAGPKTAAGNLTVSAGGRTVTIPVAVAGHIKELESFESGLGTFSGTETVSAAIETGADQVRFGKQSAKLTYDASAAGTASVTCALTIPTGERYLGVWVYGDGSGNTLTVTAADQTGATADAVVGALDFTGWKQFLVALPQNTLSLRSFNVISGGAKAAGTIWLDQLTTSNESFTDTTAPTVTATLTGNNLTAVVSDNLDKKFDQKAITLTVDGKTQAFNWNADKNTLTATLSASDGKLHRVTVSAVDQSGNLGRGSVDRLPGEDVSQPSPFVDMTGHWALAYTNYLYNSGVTTGITTPTGPAFNPEANITRGEFALMVARWMGLDLNAYTGVELPFSDVKNIPDWALKGARAMYATGIIKGSLDGGNLVFRAASTISRAEAMTILGRIQTKGYPRNALAFGDAASVPAWALPYVQSLTGQGVVSGYNNQVRPNDPVKRSEVAKMLYTIL